MRVEGRVALVTGGSTGIGRASVLRLAREGASVVVADINDADGEETATSAGGRFVHCDVSDPEQVQRAVDETVAAFGTIDILVNSAAFLGGAFPAGDMPDDEWRRGIAVTLDGIFYASKCAVQVMAAQGRGSIVSIASVEGVAGAAKHAAYVTAKSAIFGLTRSMAIDYGTSGVRVNAISPGIIDNGRPEQAELKKDPEVMRFWREMTVLDRMGTPDEIANAVLFLASDEASYITGQNLIVDGGWTIGHAPLPW
ncbi:MAG: SDR family oxidoreductase [Thermomicrobiales bacterium]|nr:SDR family oxidoreductase [Thermomicrobiales bacterium]